ncbi:putative secreted protein [Wickerhamomyces ciferrii]|uniref:Secreted protein n=1 Tax=Wickerhamomyces ciferrii (strain ATCC 14091 / BCRC 22168 / CBS 111 / JCM 3599 / NBRC 0793 / NRRL Y-1031 F-60-10) TaxID=1206466 RepID=K0KYC5_WICCF|nr:uncharacterized protein BN7_6691 [Wickerhamomyces ciferrii]CCH47082.1 putative secreted protein [Wickerhamomyces ciferrii]
MFRLSPVLRSAASTSVQAAKQQVKSVKPNPAFSSTRHYLSIMKDRVPGRIIGGIITFYIVGFWPVEVVRFFTTVGLTTFLTPQPNVAAEAD